MCVYVCVRFTCSGVESAPTLCRLRHRDAHRALATLSDHDSSESGSSACLLALPPELSSTIIHRDTRGMAASMSSDSRDSRNKEGRLKKESDGGQFSGTFIAMGGATDPGAKRSGSGCWQPGRSGSLPVAAGMEPRRSAQPPKALGLRPSRTFTGSSWEAQPVKVRVWHAL